MSYLIIVMFITISHQVSYGDGILNVLEGEVAKLYFPYPCDSTEITLRRGHSAPFYIYHVYANPISTALPSRYEIENNKNENDHICSLYLTISPVSRDDTGFYILITYKDGVMQPHYTRIELRVNYPPGKASCELSNDYNDEEWVSLQCTATVGNLAGQIICYQDGMKLPSLTLPEENGKTLNQIILTRLAGLVYCCSSTIEQTKDRCECNDFRWNPIHNAELSIIPDPCATTIQIAEQESTTSKDLRENSTSHPKPSDSLPAKNTHTADYWLYVIIASLVLTVTILSLLLRKAREKKKEFQKRKDKTKNRDVKRHELNKLA